MKAKTFGGGRFGAGQGGRGVSGGLAALSMLAVAGLAGVSGAQPTGLEQPVDAALYRPAMPEPSDGGAFVVTKIALALAENAEGGELLPSLAEFETVEFDLLQTPAGFVAPRDGLPTVTLTIAEINGQGVARTFHASAIVAMCNALVNEFNRRGVIGVFIAPDNIYLARADNSDARQGDTSMTLRVSTARVSMVRTLASGTRIAPEARRDNPAHDRIRKNSPLQPGGEGPEDRSLLRRDLLDRYSAWLNRHPGRRVDSALAPGAASGEAVLDYLVYETKPWTLYFQLSNTGTKNTGEWRERFGFIHNQLTNNDDILAIDYITSGFEDAHALIGSYEAPFPGAERLRWRVEASWNEYTASDVGFASEDFTGDGYSFGGDLIWNVYQEREFFVDVVGGVKYQNITTTNEVVDIEGDESFTLPHVGVRLERFRETDSFTGEVMVEVGFGGDEEEMTNLGRLFPDEDWFTLNYDFNYSFFLEPLLNPVGWADADTARDPDTWADSTLAHEVSLTAKGQHAFDHRLVPNFESVVGGAYTVRGYDESVAAADNTYIFSAEYRYHVPRAFKPKAEPGRLFGSSFKWAPQQVFGRPDWDLVLSGFTDFAFTSNSEALAFEEDETLWSVGVGVEVVFKRNVTMSVDWGYVLEDASDNESGDNNVHFVLTLLY